MNVPITKKIIFTARNIDWYDDLVHRLKQKWNFDSVTIPYFFSQQHTSKSNILFDSIVLFFYVPIIFLLKGKGIYILTTRHLPFLFWFKILSFFRINTIKVLAMNFYFHSLRETIFVKSILRFLINNKNLSIIAPSRNDYDYFKKLSDTPSLYFIIFGIKKKNTNFPVKDGNYIFCGGYANRDFELVLKIAGSIEKEFIIIMSGREKIDLPHPHNVRIFRDIEFSEFQAYLANAELVIIPLKDDHGASGQIVTLSAMAFGKPVVYTDYNVISDYFIDGVNGISYKSGDRKDLKNKVLLCLNNSKLREDLGQKAKQYFETNFTSEATNSKIIDVVSKILNG